MILRQKFSKGMPVFGTWIQTVCPVTAEIIAQSGFDFAVLDMEHTFASDKDFSDFKSAVQKSCSALARVRQNSTMDIRRPLDIGAEGVIVPLVNTASEAEAAVQSAKFPPRGIRGFAFCSANRWGADFDVYAASANENTLVIVMIETKQAVENIDEILDVDGVDGVFIGPYDLSGSFGVTGQTSHPVVIEAKRTVLEACSKRGKVAGQHIVLPTSENVREAITEGYKFIALGTDTVFIRNGAASVLDLIK